MIRELRIEKGLTQDEAAKLTGLSLRTFQNYEYEKSTRDKFKIEQIIKILDNYEKYSEDKGIVTLDYIKEKVTNTLKDTNISFVYLFGSYASGEATEKSDIDLLISSEEKGLNFIFLQENLKTNLHKRIDLIRIDDLKDNFDFLNVILTKGIKIYGRE